MKPLFCIDVTENKKNEEINGRELITATAPQVHAERLENKQEELEQTLEKSQLPAAVRMIKFLCGCFGAIVLCAVVKSTYSNGFAQAWKNAPVLILAGVICAVAWVVLQVISKTKEKRVLEERGAEETAAAIQKDIESVYESLGVPFNAPTVDVLMFRYRIKDGEPVAKEMGLQTTPYLNLEVRLYVDGDALCVADLENVYTIPRAALKRMRTVKKRIAVPVWNKEEGPDQGSYKSYKLTVSNMGDVFFKPYHVLEFEHEGESWGIYFPCYEKDVFEAVTGLHAEEL